MALNNIVVNDGATTPVSHTFVGISGQQTPTSYSVHVEKLAGMSPQAWPKLELQAGLSMDPKKDHVARIRLTVPNVKLVDGIEVAGKPSALFCTVVYPNGIDVATESKRLFGLLTNIMGNAETKGVMIDLLPRQ